MDASLPSDGRDETRIRLVASFVFDLAMVISSSGIFVFTKSLSNCCRDGLGLIIVAGRNTVSVTINWIMLCWFPWRLEGIFTRMGL